MQAAMSRAQAGIGLCAQSGAEHPTIAFGQPRDPSSESTARKRPLTQRRIVRAWQSPYQSTVPGIVSSPRRAMSRMTALCSATAEPGTGRAIGASAPEFHPPRIQPPPVPVPPGGPGVTAGSRAPRWSPAWGCRRCPPRRTRGSRRSRCWRSTPRRSSACRRRWRSS